MRIAEKINNPLVLGTVLAALVLFGTDCFWASIHLTHQQVVRTLMYGGCFVAGALLTLAPILFGERARERRLATRAFTMRKCDVDAYIVKHFPEPKEQEELLYYHDVLSVIEGCNEAVTYFGFQLWAVFFVAGCIIPFVHPVLTLTWIGVSAPFSLRLVGLYYDKKREEAIRHLDIDREEDPLHQQAVNQVLEIDIILARKVRRYLPQEAVHGKPQESE